MFQCNFSCECYRDKDVRHHSKKSMEIDTFNQKTVGYVPHPHLMDLSKFNEDDTNWAEAKSWLLSLSRCKQWFAIQFLIDFKQSFISGSFWDIKWKTQQDVVTARKLLSSSQRTLCCSCVFKVQRFTVHNVPQCSAKFLSAFCDEIVFSGGMSQVRMKVIIVCKEL